MSEMIMGVDFGAKSDRSVTAVFTVTPEGWTFYDEAQNIRTWPCLGSGLHVYATGAANPVTFECVECGKLWTSKQLDAGHAPYHAKSRRTDRQLRRKDRAARKRRRGW